MNKAELVATIQEILGEGTTKAASERALDAVLQAITTGIKSEAATVQLIGFGTFSVVQRAARNGINPRTKKKLKIKASKTVKFKPGASLKESL
ncbi:MAG: HU family DNA-binding protein [Verrucomicrobiota bacterium]|nr:HU family DNA-binding protein [Verrucomicrobiota bacterium]